MPTAAPPSIGSSRRRARGSTRRARHFRAFRPHWTLGFILILLVTLSSANARAAVDVGFEDFEFGSGVDQDINRATSAKPESKLWYTDEGIWWAVLYNPGAAAFTIHRLNIATQSWVDTGVHVDERAHSRQDALLDGRTLYIASRFGEEPPQNRLLRFTYDPGAQQYALDPGFPVEIPGGGTESLTIAKDSTGTLWIAYTSDRYVYVSHSLDSDMMWATPFVVPITDENPQAPDVATDDIAGAMALDGAIGIFWSNQATKEDYFAVHPDGTPPADPAAWGLEVAATGGSIADDHFNMKMAADGQLFVAVKTSFTDPDETLVGLLVRQPGGTWSGLHHVGTVAVNPTRPTCLLDEVERTVHVLYSVDGSAIHMKSANMDGVSFPDPDGPGTPFIASTTTTDINNPTTTKQNVSPSTGFVVAASSPKSKSYWHNAIVVDCADPTTPDGAECDDHSACTRSDACVAGRCVGTDPVVCEALDACHDVGTCDPTTGACSNPAKPDGTACDDGDLCTESGTCAAGVCSGADPVVCTPLDACHEAGECDPATGQCSNPPKICPALDPCHEGSCDPSTGQCSSPPKPDGAACDDGDLCTRGDTCAAGRCTAGEPVTCPPLDACHEAGVCDQATGFCSNPQRPDGTACDDGNACTQTGQCTAGRCTGTDERVCTALDQCHVPGECDPTTGTCSNPPKDDVVILEFPAIADTYADGRDPLVSFGASGSLEADGRWDRSIYLRFAVAGIDGLVESATVRLHTTFRNDAESNDGGSIHAVSDGGWSEQTLTYDNRPPIDGPVLDRIGEVRKSQPVDFDVSAAIEGDGVYNFGITSASRNTVVYRSREANSDRPELIITMATPCYGGSTCSELGACVAGACVGTDSTGCVTSDPCHEGFCDPATGECSGPPKPDGTPCDDGNGCTRLDACVGGECVGANPVQCPAPDACHDPGTCDPATGTCSHPRKPDGAACADGDACTTDDACVAGVCLGRKVVCPVLDACHDPGECNPATGQCSYPVRSAVRRFPADADTYTDAGDPSDNFGAMSSARVDDSPERRLYLRFAIDGIVDATVRSAVLRLSTTDASNAGSDDGGTVRAVSNVAWEELGLTHENRPALTGEELASAGAVERNSVVELDVTAAISGNGVYAFGLTSASDNGVTYWSREAGAGGPELLVALAPPCDDGNACTTGDTCIGGECVGGETLTCRPADACHETGPCDPATGRCFTAARPDGTPCDDGAFCTVADACRNGICTGIPRACGDAPGTCRERVCDEAGAACLTRLMANGSPCDDGDACTQADACVAGSCQGTDPVMCTALDQCHEVGVCDPTTGACSNPATQDGLPCDDGDPCTADDGCVAGICAGYPASDENGESVCDAIETCSYLTDGDQADLDADGIVDRCQCTTPAPGYCIAGGGSARTDCLVEVLSAGPISLNRRGTKVKPVLRCTDGDPACDLDGTRDRICTFGVSLCFGNTDPRLPECPSHGIRSMAIVQPNARRAKGLDRRNARGLERALGALGLEVRGRRRLIDELKTPVGDNHCSRLIQLRVPAPRTRKHRTVKRKFKLRAIAIDGRRDKDRFVLRCERDVDPSPAASVNR